jgi:Short C-terminal domain
MTQPQMQPQDRLAARRLSAGKPASAGRRVGGIVLMLAGVALMGYGAHYIFMTGNCSSTGYSSIGPVPKCGGGEALYILSLFFLGPALAVVGWLLAQAWGALWPLTCVSFGAALVTIQFAKSPTAGAKAFAVLAGTCLFALAVLSVVITVRKRLRRQAAPVGLAGLGVADGTMMPVVFDAPPAMSGALPAMDAPVFDPPAHDAPQVASGSRPDPLDQIAKLARLRDSGALTEEEFEREKAKILAQM